MKRKYIIGLLCPAALCFSGCFGGERIEAEGKAISETVTCVTSIIGPESVSSVINDECNDDGDFSSEAGDISFILDAEYEDTLNIEDESNIGDEQDVVTVTEDSKSPEETSVSTTSELTSTTTSGTTVTTTSAKPTTTTTTTKKTTTTTTTKKTTTTTKPTTKPTSTTTTTTTKATSTTTVQTSSPSGEHSTIETKLAETFKTIKNVNGRYAVKVYSLKDGSTFGSGEQTAALVSASLIKLYVAGTVYENYDKVNSQQKYTGETENLLNTMISQSDNVSCNTLVQRLGNGNYDSGMAMVNSFCKKHGFTATSMNRIMLNFNGKENYTSVTDCCRFLTMVYKGELLGSDKIIAYMKAQKTRTKIPAGITDGTVVANKTGELAAVENDTAIVYAKSGAYIMCVMCNNLTNTSTARKTISTASSQVYAYMK